MEKICLFCKHFYFSTGDPGYSDMTPGEDMHILCLKVYWYIDNYEDTTETYRQKLLTAKMCKDFEWYNAA
jgi:hypothetical protein